VFKHLKLPIVNAMTMAFLIAGLSNQANAQVHCAGALQTQVVIQKTTTTTPLATKPTESNNQSKWARFLSRPNSLSSDQNIGLVNEFLNRDAIMGPVQMIATMMAALVDIEPNIISIRDLAKTRMRATEEIDTPQGMIDISPVSVSYHIGHIKDKFNSSGYHDIKSVEAFLDRSFLSLDILIKILDDPSESSRELSLKRLDEGLALPFGRNKWIASLSYLRDLKKDPIKYDAFRRTWLLSSKDALELSDSYIKGDHRPAFVLDGILMAGVAAHTFLAGSDAVVAAFLGSFVFTGLRFASASLIKPLDYPFVARTFAFNKYFLRKIKKSRVRQLVLDQLRRHDAQASEMPAPGSALEQVLDQAQDAGAEKQMHLSLHPKDLDPTLHSSIMEFGRGLVAATHAIADSLALLDARLTNSPKELRQLLKQAEASGLTTAQNRQLRNELRQRIDQMAGLTKDYEQAAALLRKLDNSYQFHLDVYNDALNVEVPTENRISLAKLGERMAAQKAILSGFNTSFQMIRSRATETSDALQNLEMGLIANSLQQTLSSDKMQAFLKELGETSE
jgi:hypothetical protein